MLFDKIREDGVFDKKYMPERCEDEGLCVDIDPRIAAEDCLILKPDGYYNGLNLGQTPPMPDCFMLIRCLENDYGLTIVEMTDTANFIWKEKFEKFENCFRVFMEQDFPQYFDRDYNRIQLFFVSQKRAYRSNIDDSLVTKTLMSKQFRFRNKIYQIHKHLPTPAVKPCY